MLTVNTKHSYDKRGMKAAYKRAVRRGLRHLAKHYHRKIFPRHFEDGAASRYGYDPRSPNYEKYKRMRHGHTLPLVKTGSMMRSLLGARRITANARRSVLTLDAGGALAFRYSGKARRTTNHGEITHYRYPNVRRELDAVTTKEIQEESDFLGRYVDRKMARHAAQKGKRL